MKDVMKIIGLILALLMLVWIIQGNNFFMYKVFAPATEDVRREVFENTKSYNQGVAQDISNFQQQYVAATDSQKDALASVIIHRYADYDLSKLPPDLRSFIEKLKRGER
jgi:hypothetical protein